MWLEWQLELFRLTKGGKKKQPQTINEVVRLEENGHFRHLEYKRADNHKCWKEELEWNSD